MRHPHHLIPELGLNEPRRAQAFDSFRLCSSDNWDRNSFVQLSSVAAIGSLLGSWVGPQAAMVMAAKIVVTAVLRDIIF
jgi:hypothetical protein